jgi:hypothetical protein
MYKNVKSFLKKKFGPIHPWPKKTERSTAVLRKTAWVCAGGTRDLTHEAESMMSCHEVSTPTLIWPNRRRKPSDVTQNTRPIKADCGIMPPHHLDSQELLDHKDVKTTMIHTF